jgi:hypothetical protein
MLKAPLLLSSIESLWHSLPFLPEAKNVPNSTLMRDSSLSLGFSFKNSTLTIGCLIFAAAFT